MNYKSKTKKLVFLLVLSGSLSACGGDGGKTKTKVIEQKCSIIESTNEVTVQCGDDITIIDRPVENIVYLCPRHPRHINEIAVKIKGLLYVLNQDGNFISLNMGNYVTNNKNKCYYSINNNNEVIF